MPRPYGPGEADVARSELNAGAASADAPLVTHRSDRPRLALAIAVAVLLSFLVAPVAVAQDDAPADESTSDEPACGGDDTEVESSKDDPAPTDDEAPADDPAPADDEAPAEDPAPAEDTAVDEEVVDPDVESEPADDEAADEAETDVAPAPDPEDCPPPQVSLADLVSPAPAAVDLELQAALGTVGFLDTWYSVTSTHPRLSLVAVTSPSADEARGIAQFHCVLALLLQRDFILS